MILCLETATALCSAALCDINGVIAVRENNEGRSHASLLTILIIDLLNEAGIKAENLEAVAVSMGPGSYTGLRIGTSVAKGIAYAASLPLIGINTTFSMFRGFSDTTATKYNFTTDDLFCPVLDARRMEVYYSLYNAAGKTLKDTRAEIIDSSSFSDLPESSRLFFFGDGALKFRGILNRTNTIFDKEFRISSSFMHKPAYEAFNERRFEDVAYFEPFYLKDFLTSKPVKNILGK
jgi:tRNA threonylcarbamoyladenosine biosynthesis protein TsaB